MKNMLTSLGLVVVAAAIGAMSALQPWSAPVGKTSPIAPAESVSQTPETSASSVADNPDNSEAVSPGGNAGLEKSDRDSQRLLLAVDILKGLNKRMTALEEQVNVIELDLDRSRLNVAQTTRPEPEPEEQRVDPEQPTSAELARAQARQVYFQDIEQSIVSEFDAQFSQEITDSYAAFLATGEPWTEGVAVDTTECGASYCKVVVSYPADMDPEAQFELDGRLYMQVSSELPESKSVERRRSDGSKEILIYFAKNDVKFPRLPQ